MTLSKIQAESMNLADTYAFSGTVSGTPTSAMTPAFAVTSDPSVTEQSLSASAWTKVTMGTVLLDTDNMFATATNRFTPTIAGKYYCYFEGVATSGTTHFYVAIRKNNSTWLMNVHDGSQTGSGFCGGIIDFNGTSDYVELKAYSSVANTWGGSSHWVWWDGYWTGS